MSAGALTFGFLLPGLLIAPALLDEASAATIALASNTRTPLITIDGNIESGDETKFRELADKVGKATVLLYGNGGKTAPAIEIGRMIKAKGMGTAVANGFDCANACGLIWLAGTPRFLSKTSRVGIPSNVDRTSNDPVAGYVTLLNLPEKTQAFTTTVDSKATAWLTTDNASEAGIEVSLLGSTAAPATPAAAPVATPAAAPAATAAAPAAPPKPAPIVPAAPAAAAAPVPPKPTPVAPAVVAAPAAAPKPALVTTAATPAATAAIAPPKPALTTAATPAVTAPVTPLKPAITTPAAPAATAATVPPKPAPVATPAVAAVVPAKPAVVAPVAVVAPKPAPIVPVAPPAAATATPVAVAKPLVAATPVVTAPPATVAAPARPMVADVPFATAGAWEIRRGDASVGGGCYAMTSYAPDIVLIVGYDLAQKTVFLNVGSERLQPVDPAKSYAMQVRFDNHKPWDSRAEVGFSNKVKFMMMTFRAGEFMNEFMNANGMTLREPGKDDDKDVLKLNLARSGAAAREMLRCQGGANPLAVNGEVASARSANTSKSRETSTASNR